MKKVIAAVMILTAFAAQAKPEYQHEYYVIADFIEADRLCEREIPQACEAQQRLCPVIIENDRQLQSFIREGHPLRARNGAMNIEARYSRAKRDC